MSGAERKTHRQKATELTILVLHKDLLGEEVAEARLQTPVHLINKRFHQWVISHVLTEHDQQVADCYVRLWNDTNGHGQCRLSHMSVEQHRWSGSKLLRLWNNTDGQVIDCNIRLWNTDGQVIDCYVCLWTTQMVSHTCQPKNCVFRNKYHQNPEHSIIFYNTSANVSPQ